MEDNLIKKRRLELGMKQAQVAELIGVDVRSYRRYENGDISPTLENLIKLATAFSISPTELQQSDNTLLLIKQYIASLSTEELQEIQKYIDNQLNNRDTV